MRQKRLSDLQRIKEIIKILIEPYQDLEHMTVELKLWSTMQPEKYPIYQRKILKGVKVYGLWWMDDEQICRFLWSGHKGVIIKSGQDPDRVLAARSFMTNSSCYIRENANGSYDLEAMSFTKFRGKTVAEWMTCTVTKEIYLSIDKFLGPVCDGCRHEEQFYEYDDY